MSATSKVKLSVLSEQEWKASSSVLRDESASVERRLLAALEQMLHVVEGEEPDEAFDEVRRVRDLARSVLS